MHGVIFGSGVVGLLAQALLPTWTVIPFARSRYFTFNPALDDNFITQDDRIEAALRDIFQLVTLPTFPYRRAWDVNGHLFNRYDQSLCDDWLTKIFGAQVPPQAEPYLRGRMDLTVYNLRINQLYATLMSRYLPDLKEEAAKGPVTAIGDHYYVRNGLKEDFDNAISTIPLKALNKLMGLTQDLPAKALHYLHIQTDSLDFEGNNQALITSPSLSFFKVTNIAPHRYQFYCHEEIPHPGPYLMAFLRDFEILDGTSVADALTLGPSPKLEHLEAKGIYCVGSYAQHDWCMDIGSCLLRLLKYSQRGFKPFQKVLI